MAIITTKDLNKLYSAKSFSKERIHALKDFTFNVEQGEIFGLLGPNGAGKTTLIKILLGITLPTSGSARVFDKDIKDESYKKKVGYLPENHKFPNYLTGEEVLKYFGRLSGMEDKDLNPRIDEYLKLVDMEKARKMKIKKYSKGMMQRLGLAQSMLNNPELIFLDEPTDGVDPVGRKEIRDLLVDLKSRGVTVFLNSHILAEVELVCDRVAILNKGVLVKEGNVEELTTTEDTYRFHTSDLDEKATHELLNNYKVTLKSHNEFIYMTESIENMNRLIDFLRAHKILIHSVNLERSSLESMFINLISSQNNSNY
jgi:ABC-2 type transport system ATP-binding protein